MYHRQAYHLLPMEVTCIDALTHTHTYAYDDFSCLYCTPCLAVSLVSLVYSYYS